VKTGAVQYRIGARTMEVGPGAAVVVPAGVEHASRIEEGTEACSLWLGVDMVEEIAATVSNARHVDPQVLSAAARVGTLTELLVEEAAVEGSGTIMAVEALAETLTISVVRRLRDQTARAATAAFDPRVRAALAMIDEGYAEPLTVDDLARTAGLSRFHFSRLFREQVGASPYQHLVSVRVERAAELLRRGGRSVTEAALSVGFQDLSRFSRAFAQRFGCRPSQMMTSGRRVAIVGL